MGKSDTDDDAAANVTGNGCGVGGRHNHDCAMRSTEAGMAVGAAVAEGAEAAAGVSEESSVLPPPPSSPPSAKSSWQRRRSSSPLSTTPRTARTHEERMALKIARNSRPRHSSTGTGGDDGDGVENEWNVPNVAGAGARTARTHEERMALKISRNSRPRHSSTGTGGDDGDGGAEWNVSGIAGESAGAALKMNAVEQVAASAAETSSSSFALGADRGHAPRRGRTSEDRWRDKLSASDHEQGQGKGHAGAVAATAAASTTESSTATTAEATAAEEGSQRNDQAHIGASLARKDKHGPSKVIGDEGVEVIEYAPPGAAAAAAFTEAKEGAAYRPLSLNWDRKVGDDSGLGDNDRGKDDDYLAKCAAKSGSNMEQARAGAMEGEGTRGKRGKKQGDSEDVDEQSTLSKQHQQSSTLHRVEKDERIDSNDPSSSHPNTGRIHVPSASPGAYSITTQDPAVEAAIDSATAVSASSSTSLTRGPPSETGASTTIMPPTHLYDPSNIGGNDNLLSIPMAFRGELVPHDDDDGNNIGANGGQRVIVEAVDVKPLSMNEISDEKKLRREHSKGLFFNPWHWWDRKEKIMFVATVIGAIALGLGLGLGLTKRRRTDTKEMVIMTEQRPCDVKGPWRRVGDDLTHAQWTSSAVRPGYVSFISRAFGSSVSLSSDGSVLSVTGRFSDGVSVYRLENVTMNVTEGAKDDSGGGGESNATEAATSNSKNRTDAVEANTIAVESALFDESSASAVRAGRADFDKTDTDTNTANVVTTITKEEWVQLGTDILGGSMMLDQESDLYDAISASVLSGDGRRVAAMFPHYSDNVFTKRGLIKVYEYVEKAKKEEEKSSGGGDEAADTSSGSWEAVGDVFLGTYKEAFLGDKGTVSLSHDGTVIAVGECGYNAWMGRVRVYRIESDDDSGSGGKLSWTQLGEDLLGGSPGGKFGMSVSMSWDGSILGIGASNANDYRGSAWVYRYDEDHGAWALIGGGADDGGGALRGGLGACFFGAPLSMSSDGRRVAIYSSRPAQAHAMGDGVTLENGGDEGDGGSVDCLDWYESENNMDDVGIVLVYELSEDESEWSLLGNGLTGDARGENFGWAIDLSGDGETLAVGAPSGFRTGYQSGYVRTYHHLGGGNWTVVGRDINGTASGYWAGEDVSLTENGEKLAIGSPTDYYLPMSDFEEHPQDISGVAAVWHHCS